ncbi:hypothetical protein [Alteromonas sp. A079]|uniref:hypothetical protein n=1 Tax=Alteromonas sp. A079 TaxID=3410268 RepID=UPI003B9E3411
MKQEQINSVITLLNSHLKNHSEYENWMEFETIETKQGLGFVPRYKTPSAAGVDMTEEKAREIYESIWSDFQPQ